MERPNIDGSIILAHRELVQLLYDMREGMATPNGMQDEDGAVQWYLIYLSMLVDIILSDIVLSAIHSVDVAVKIKQRMMVEYVAKAIYCDDHPDYALWYTTIQAAESIASKYRDGGGDATEIRAA